MALQAAFPALSLLKYSKAYVGQGFGKAVLQASFPIVTAPVAHGWRQPEPGAEQVEAVQLPLAPPVIPVLLLGHALPLLGHMLAG